jgi:predicted DNA-binding protein
MANALNDRALTFNLPSALKQQMDTYRAETGIPQAVIIRTAVEKYLATHKLVEIETAKEVA